MSRVCPTEICSANGHNLTQCWEPLLIFNGVYDSRCLQYHYTTWYSCQGLCFENARHTLRPSTKDVGADSYRGQSS